MCWASTTDTSRSIAEQPVIAKPRQAERVLRVTERLVLAAGLRLFGVLVARLGIEQSHRQPPDGRLGHCLDHRRGELAFAANTLGRRAAFPAGVRVPSFGRLLLVRIAGDSINYLTPTANLGGEFVRVRMLQGQAEVAPLVASVVVAKLT